MIVKNNKYFCDQLNSSKAYQFTCQYHYSHVGFKKSSINLGIFNINTNELVGVMQWGISAQENIRLDRYVKEPITKEQYLELNRFCMADSEEKNSESQAISLGIKWLKINRPDIKLLVSYAGRKEGNYGYIYQATNWIYLGYFVSSGFWLIDGQEKHKLTLWYHYKKYARKDKGFIYGLCDLYHDVRQYWSKQFIYVILMDKNLTLANNPLPYPKPSTDSPIVEKINIYKEDLLYYNLNNTINYNEENIKFYYNPDERLFTREALIRQGKEKRKNKRKIAEYDYRGVLLNIYNSINEINIKDYNRNGIYRSANKNIKYKDKYFKWIDNEEEIIQKLPNIYPICIIDNMKFYNQKSIIKYTGVTKQAVNSCKNRRGKTIAGKPVIWISIDKE